MTRRPCIGWLPLLETCRRCNDGVHYFSLLPTLLFLSPSPELVGSFYLDGQLTFHPYLGRPVKSTTAARSLRRDRKSSRNSQRVGGSGAFQHGLREIPHVLALHDVCEGTDLVVCVHRGVRRRLE